VDAENEQRLCVRLDAPLPRTLAVGGGTALFVCGTCFHSAAKIRALSVAVDGQCQPVSAFGMPRLDLFRSLHPGLDAFHTAGMSVDPGSAEDPYLHSYRSGFWGTVEIGPAESATRELVLWAELESGAQASQTLASLETVELPEPLRAAEPERDEGALVAICMASYQAPLGLFRRQIESIRAQTHRNWVCVISDDCSSPERFAAMREELAGDDRFVLSRAPRRLGFYLNFERALALAPAHARFVALADQDDDWCADKLATLLARIGDAQLVYSDARVIDRDGQVVSETYWTARRNNHTEFLSLLMTNAVTGAASLFRRQLLDSALPFPPAQFAHFHDHWIAVVALALGEIEFVDRPLYDYVQHDRAVLGHTAANWMPPLRTRLRRLRRDPRERVVLWRHHYFVDVCRLTQWATIIRMRCAEAMAGEKRRGLDRFLGLEGSLWSLADLWRRGAGELVARRSETLGAEWMLAYAFTWRRLLGASVRERPVEHLRLDAVPPPELLVTPGRPSAPPAATAAISEKIAGLELEVSDQAPERVNLLIPTIDLDHFFGGYIGKFNLARRLAEHGLRVRLVTVDPIGPVPLDWRRSVQAYAGLDGLFERVEVAFGREGGPLQVSRSDAFIATTWWTAHVARQALASLGGERFLYLIQEYEPFTFPMGTYAALAAGSYEFPHDALFSTELLREYFRGHRIGVYADGPDRGDARSAVFQNAITVIEPPSAAALRRRQTRRLLFYARPEPHASRNMFELGILALQRALHDGAFDDGWQLDGIGTMSGARSLSLGAGAELKLLPRSDQNAYASLLREYDVGLALMYTPHPSLVPIEMASAGMVTVTNRFENKTEAAMTAISPNLLAPPATIDGVAGALRSAATRSGDYERRAHGSAVQWSRDWDESFTGELIDRVIALLKA
jgi:glycosyltransferase involved in cell wall biosynthesis